MNSIRRATPDSEAIASSEDERPWPTAPAFGSLPHKENGVPGFGGGIWSTQKRGSFKMEKTAQRNAAREALLGAPGQPRSGWRKDATPSPSASEGSGALPFQIPLHPAPKAGRSLSHSQGQREYPPVTSAHSTQPDHAQALPLGLLAEEVDTESESDLGTGLTHTTSHPPIGTLHRTATFPVTYDSYYNTSNGQEQEETLGGAQVGSREDRRFDAAFSNHALEQAPRRAQWQSHLGWSDLPLLNESRRHSLADVPRWSEREAPRQFTDYELTPTDTINDAIMLSRQFAEARTQASNDPPLSADSLPQSYRVNPARLPAEQRDQTLPGPAAMGPPNQQQLQSGTRPRKILYVVSFKCSRADVFYLFDNTGLAVREGDIVIVEADRGQDLGTVQHADVSAEEARRYRRFYSDEHYKWVMMFSKNNAKGSVNPNAQDHGNDNHSATLASAGHQPAISHSTMQHMSRDTNLLKPKAIKRLASSHEIRVLSDKEGNEAKAKRTCQTKVAALKLDMEILDAEWQWDFQKLTFYYYADHYINFKELITELFRIYKARIWFSAENPASMSQHTLGILPSGLGPGALNPKDRDAYLSQLATVVDPDPYGAIPPYNIGYDTYTPNYPAIPGVINSFSPQAPMPYTRSTQIAGSGMGSSIAPPSSRAPNMQNVPMYGGYAGFGGYNYAGPNAMMMGPSSALPVPGAPQPFPFPTQPVSDRNRYLDDETNWAGTSGREFRPGHPPGTRHGDRALNYGSYQSFGGRSDGYRQGYNGRIETTTSNPTPFDLTSTLSNLAISGSGRASGQQQPAQAPTSFGGSNEQMLFGARSNDSGSNGLVESYLDSLQSPEDRRADEMSRER